jgi:hypothetical protein
MYDYRGDYLADWKNDLAHVPSATAKTRQERLHQPVKDVLYSLMDAFIDQRISAEEKTVFRDQRLQNFQPVQSWWRTAPSCM